MDKESESNNNKNNNEYLVEELLNQIALNEIEISEKNRIIQDIYSGQTWKIALFLQEIFHRIAPSDSFLNKFSKSLWQLFKYIRRNFLRLFIKHQSKKTITYNQWIQKTEPKIRKELLKNLNRYPSSTLFSIILPVFQPASQLLNETINSVLAQDYPKWELFIVNGCLKDIRMANLLESFSKKDPRIKVLNLDKNLGITGNINTAIGIAEGNFIAFLEQEDLLAPFALSAVMDALQQYPETDVFYSDEDKLNEDRLFRYSPFFKPAYSPDFLQAINYIGHFWIVRKSLGNQIGWVRDTFKDVWNYDLILRITEKAQYVTHIPLILYHYRSQLNSTTFSSPSPNIKDSGIQVISDHMIRIGMQTEVIKGHFPDTFQILFNRDWGKPLISIIIPNHNHAGDLEKCINSIIDQSTYKNIEILVIENNSDEKDTFEVYKNIEKLGNIRILKYNYPFNYSKINNFAVHSANGEILLFLNNDTEVIAQDWLEQMLIYALRPDVGAVGAKLSYPDNSIQHGGVIITSNGIAVHIYKGKSKAESERILQLNVPQNYSAVTGACLMVKKSIFNEVGGFDPIFELALNDIDFCLKIRKKGFTNVWTPYSELYHFESKTRGFENTPKKANRFLFEKTIFENKWNTILEEGDPYFNPNLSLNSESFYLSPNLEKLHPRALKNTDFREFK